MGGGGGREKSKQISTSVLIELLLKLPISALGVKY